MVLAASPDAAQFLQAVSVVHHNLIGLGIDHVEQAVLCINRDSYRIDQLFVDLAHHLVLGVEDEDAVQFAVGDEDAVVVVDRDTVDQSEVACWPLAISSTSRVSVLKMKTAPTLWSAT